MNLKDIFKGHILKKMIFIIILRYARQAHGGRLPPPPGGGDAAVLNLLEFLHGKKLLCLILKKFHFFSNFNF